MRRSSQALSTRPKTDRVASNEWYALAFGSHAYGRPSSGTDACVKAISTQDLEDYRKRVFARANLRVVAVGDISAAELGPLVDKVFWQSSGKSDLVSVPKVDPITGGKTKIIEMDSPSRSRCSARSQPRKDPDFLTAFVLNQLIGGGGFASRLMEKCARSALGLLGLQLPQPMRNASIFRVASPRATMQSRHRSPDPSGIGKGPLQRAPTSRVRQRQELSHRLLRPALRHQRQDRNTALGLMEEGYGPDYVEKRNALIEAITLEDAKRVAKRLMTTAT